MRAVHRPHSPRPPHRGAAAACALAITALTSGCGFTNALAHPASSSAAAAPSAPASATASPPEAAAAAADLVGSSDGRPASLQVRAIAAQRGAPAYLLPGGCHPAPGSTEYATISVTFTNHAQPTKQTGVSSNLRVDLSVTGGTGVGILAYEFDSSRSCDDVAPPSSATMQSQDLGDDEHQTFTVYLVGPSGPAGRDPLRGVTLELRDPRHHPDDIDSGAWTWDVQHVRGGSTCPGDANSVCVPLG